MEHDLWQSQLTRRDVLRLAAVAGGTAAAASFLAACGSPSSLTSAGAVKRGGTLRVAQDADITQLDPMLANIVEENAILYNIYETLGYFDDKTLLVTPRLAKSWAWADNDQSVTFKLQQGVTFHDGTPMTAADVKYSYTRMQDTSLGSSFTPLISDLQTVDIIDNATVRFNTAGFSNKLIAALPHVAIIPNNSGSTIAKKPNGTGPFKFVDWVVNDHVQLVKNSHYWQPSLPYLDGVTITPITDDPTRVTSLQSGQQDLLYNIPSTDVAQFKGNSRYQVVLAPPVDQPWDGYINTKRAPFSSLEARQALFYAIDRQGFVDTFLAGLGDVAYSPLAKAHWAFDPSLVGKYKYDLTKAASLLASAGYPGGQGFNVTMIIPSGIPQYVEISTLVQGAISSLGGKASIQQYDINTWIAKLTAHEFDLAFDTDVNHAGDPAILFALTYLWHPDPKNNLSQFTDDMAPGYSALIAQAAIEKDQTTRKAQYAKIQEQFMDLAVGPMVCFKSIPHAMTSSVRGFVPAIEFQQSYSEVWLSS